MTRAPAAAAPLRLDAELAARMDGDPLAVMLDVDGTLSPIAPRPEDAVVPAATKRALAALAVRRGVHVALVSGRAARDAQRMVGTDNVWVLGNHGVELITPDGDATADPRAEPYRAALAQVAQTLRALTAPIRGVLIEDKVWTVGVHYRLASEGVEGRLRGVTEELARRHGLRVTTGKKVIELRPPVQIDKGTAALALAQELGALSADASLLFAGDDVTDEDAFRALRRQLPHAVTVRVLGAESDRPTAAEFTLPDTDAVCRLLEWLAKLRR
jgi:trehalose 6-phosphate phosphatase